MEVIILTNQHLNQRVEILFVYDVSYNNPNGDPLDENKPRIDYNTGYNIVTDVRLKRTIRDYLLHYKNLDIFVKEERKPDGNLVAREEKIEELTQDSEKIRDELIRRFIDIRLFGCTIAVKKNTIILTGPAQFKFGRSLHKVDLQYIKGTTVMPSGEGKTQGTLTAKYILPYSLISFYGVINEKTAETQKLNLTYEDINLLFEAMWNGINFLNTTSKIGHRSILLLSIFYKSNTLFQIGSLDDLIYIESEKSDEEIRTINDYYIKIEKLLRKIENHKDKIDIIKIKYIPDLKFKHGELVVDLSDTLGSIVNIEEIRF